MSFCLRTDSQIKQISAPDKLFLPVCFLPRLKTPANASRWHSKLRARSPFPSFCCIMTASGPVFKMPGTYQPLPSFPGRCVARRPDFFAENPRLVTTSARNPPPFTFVHAYAGAQNLAGRFFRVWGRERSRFWPGGRRMALSAFSRCGQRMLW